MGKAVADPEALLETYKAVIVSAGLEEPMRLGIPGEEYALSWQEYLERQKQIAVAGKKVAVLGGGAVAVDCATTAKRHGAPLGGADLPPPAGGHAADGLRAGDAAGVWHRDCQLLQAARGHPQGPEGHRPSHRPDDAAQRESGAAGELRGQPEGVAGVPRVRPGHLRHWQPAAQCRSRRPEGIFYAGDMVLGSATVVEAVATGKNAALEADAFIRGEKPPRFKNRAKSREVLAGLELCPGAARDGVLRAQDPVALPALGGAAHRRLCPDAEGL